MYIYACRSTGITHLPPHLSCLLLLLLSLQSLQLSLLSLQLPQSLLFPAFSTPHTVIHIPTIVSCVYTCTFFSPPLSCVPPRSSSAPGGKHTASLPGDLSQTIGTGTSRIMKLLLHVIVFDLLSAYRWLLYELL